MFQNIFLLDAHNNIPENIKNKYYLNVKISMFKNKINTRNWKNEKCDKKKCSTERILKNIKIKYLVLTDII